MSKKEKYLFNGFLMVMLVLGLVWARSSYAKITGGTFAASLGVVLEKTAPNNPYPFYKSFLYTLAIPNAEVFGYLTMIGEFLVAVSMLVSIYLLFKNSRSKLANRLMIAGLWGGAFLNLNFWFAFSATSVSVDNLNLLMLALELCGVRVFKALASD